MNIEHVFTSRAVIDSAFATGRLRTKNQRNYKISNVQTFLPMQWCFFVNEIYYGNAVYFP